MRPGTLGTWEHYAVVSRRGYDAARQVVTCTSTLYVNGAVAATVTRDGATEALTSLRALYLGNSGVNGQRPLYGDLDDVRFYSGALTDEEVRGLYAAAPTPAAGTPLPPEPAAETAATATVELPAPLRLGASAPADATALRWEKLRGPGDVWFAAPAAAETWAAFGAPGVYRLRLVAANGAAEPQVVKIVTVTATGAADSLADGLVRHYPMNAPPYNREAVGGSTAMTFKNAADAARDNGVFPYRAGVLGYGLRMYNANAYADTGFALPEVGTEAQTPTSPRYLAFSCWMYHDTADTNVCKLAALVSVDYTLGLYYSPETGGLTLFQQGVGGSVMTLEFPAPALSPRNRWTHVYALYDRVEGQDFALYVDGARVEPSNPTVRKYAGRVRSTVKLKIGGMTETTGGTQGPQTDPATGVRYSRVFPGVIDELRIYNRKLGEAEIRALAVEPFARFGAEPAEEVVFPRATCILLR